MTKAKQNTMQAVAIDQFGGLETITLQTLPVPEVGPDEVLIRVESAGVGVWDPFEREGGFAKMSASSRGFPTCWAPTARDGRRRRQARQPLQGGRPRLRRRPHEPQGRVLRRVHRRQGRQRLAHSRQADDRAGGRHALRRDDRPRGLDDVLGLKPGESLMIFGAGGGIGHLAVQLAKRMGARVLAVASGDDGVALAKRLGADVVVNGRKDDVAAAAREFAPAGLDAALHDRRRRGGRSSPGGDARGGPGRLPQRRGARAEGAARRTV